MNNTPETLSIMEIILHGGPVIMLAYALVSLSALVLLFHLAREILTGKRANRDVRAWIPFPAIVAISGVACWFVLLRKLLASSAWEPSGLVTAISEAMLLAFFGTSLSIVLYLISLCPSKNSKID